MKQIVITGGTGFVGRHLSKILPHAISIGSQWDLRRRDQVEAMYDSLEPDIVIHLAAVCGGIGANQNNPGKFFYDNLMMGMEMIDVAKERGVEKFVQIGTVCAYPKFTPAPFTEDNLWNGYPEETNAPYGIAKKALLVQCQAYRQQYGLNAIYLIPVNLYGPGDNFDPESSHVIPALIKRFVEAKQKDFSEVEIWGSGAVSREFLYVKDAAEAIVSATELYNDAEPVNIGTGEEITIGALARMIADKIGYVGEILFNADKPNGQPRRCLDVQKAYREFNFQAKTRLEIGLDKTIEWYYNEKMEAQ